MDTLSDLINKIKAKSFESEGAPLLKDYDLKDIRLRRYYPRRRVWEDVYDAYDVQLIELGLTNNVDLKVELRGADGKFEDYNPNLRQYRIWTWDSYVKHREKEDGVDYSKA